MRGSFISLEGPDGSGKTSQAEPLAIALRQRGLKVVLTREPGGTPTAEKLRGMLLNDPMPAKAELMLFYAARIDHIHNVIQPALDRGDVVVCDRFTDTTHAYQGYGRQLHAELKIVEDFAIGNFQPDHTLFFDVTFDESIKRISKRQEKLYVFEKQGEAFTRRVFQGFQARADEFPERIYRVNAMHTEAIVSDIVAHWVDEAFMPAHQKRLAEES